MSDPIIVDNVSLKFNLVFEKELYIRDIFVNLLNRRSLAPLFNRSRIFWALKDVNLRIRHGEIVALIGSNGSGKSTLLRTIAGIYRPDKGKVITEGSIILLSAFTTGFKPELSGVENVYNFASLLGLSSKWVDKNIETIMEIADIGAFADAPLKTYSTGMKSRLGFATAISIRPDILLLDEVMGVGDHRFQKTYGNIIHNLKDSKAIVVATHDLNYVTSSCSRAILLDKGRVVFDGLPQEAVSLYKKI